MKLCLSTLVAMMSISAVSAAEWRSDLRPITIEYSESWEVSRGPTDDERRSLIVFKDKTRGTTVGISVAPDKRPEFWTDERLIESNSRMILQEKGNEYIGRDEVQYGDLKYIRAKYRIVGEGPQANVESSYLFTRKGNNFMSIRILVPRESPVLMQTELPGYVKDLLGNIALRE